MDIDKYPEAKKLYELLRKAPPNEYVPNLLITTTVDCERGGLHKHIAVVRRWVESNDRRKLCNKRGVGFKISQTATEEIDECLKECMRSVSHMRRLQKTIVEIIDDDSIEFEDDAEIHAFCAAIETGLGDLLAQAASFLKSREALERVNKAQGLSKNPNLEEVRKDEETEVEEKRNAGEPFEF